MVELVDLYDANRQRLGLVHRRGSRLQKGQYVLVVCVWVSDGCGRLLVTLRAPEKSASPNTWENSGGAAQAGETSLQAIVRELREETGIEARPEEFLLMEMDQTKDTLFDFYFLLHPVELADVVLQPGETVAARWVTLEEMDWMVEQGIVAQPIARRYRRHRSVLRALVWGNNPPVPEQKDAETGTLSH